MVIAGVLLLQGVTSAVDGANRAAWAVVISYTFSFTASTVCFFLFGGKLAKPNKQLKPLFRATVPITSVRASSSIVNSAVAVLLPAMLVRAGASSEEALSLLGIVSGMAMPVLFIPSTIIGSLSLVLVPELAEDFYRKNTRRLYQNISRGLSVTLLVSLCLIPFFYAFGGDLGSLAFSEPLVGEFIKKGSLILLPMSLTMITTGMLNSMGFEKQTFLYYFAGAAAMLLCILFLPAVCGAYAYVWGLGASFTLNAVLNLFLLHKKCNGLYKSMWQGRGQGSVQPLLRAVLLVLPIALCGSLSLALFKRVFGQFFALVLSGVCTGILTLGLWCALGVLPLKNLIKLRAKK
jgi:O-antigen/teichoic acid export membrane protein